MMDWKVILLILLIVSYLIVIWFFTIKDMVKHYHYLKSQKKTNGAKNDNCDNEPKPECLSYIEGLNCLTNCNDKPYKACYTKDNYERLNSSTPSVTLTHIKHIISRIKRWCNQKQIKPIIAMLALLAAIIFGVFYCLRHRTRINRWIENYAAKDIAVEKDTRIRALRRKMEDAEAEIADLESASPEEK